MKRLCCRALALALGLVLPLGPALVAAQTAGEVFAAGGDAHVIEDGEVTPACCGCESAECSGDCGGGCKLDLLSGGSGGMQFFGGAEYLSVRPNFSQALAYVDITAPAVNNPTQGRDYREFDFDYESSYRWFVGVRDICCGYDLQLMGANLGGSSSAGVAFEAGVNAFQTPFPTFDGTTFNSGGAGATPGGAFTAANPLVTNGARFAIDANVDLDYWDLTFSKTIPLGSPLCCDDGGCCNSCDCGPCCPAWDITWSGGIRVADGGWTRNATLVNLPGTPTGSIGVSAAESLDFSGAGLVGGLGGRRYFGRSGTVSVFLNTDVGLLLGDVNYNRNVVTQAANPINDFDRASFTRIVPVIDIEAGATVQLSSSAKLSAGYLLQSWHDLGMGVERTSFAPADTTLTFDDANILGFDGFFVRGELAF